MNLFAQWTDIAQVNLAKKHPTIKLSQTRELLSTWVGHNTFASLKQHDLAIINERRALYIIVNGDDVVARARKLGISLTYEDWISTQHKLTPSGVSGGFWLVWMQSLLGAARSIFEESSHPEKYRLSRQVGNSDGFRNTTADFSTKVDDFPLDLIVDVHSELLTFNEQESIFFPVHGKVSFKRVGTRIYEKGQVISFEQMGASGHYVPNDDDYELEYSGIYE